MDFRLESFIIGLLLFSLFIVCGLSIWGSIIDTYDVDTTTDALGVNFTSSVYDVIDESYNMSQDLKAATLDAEVDTSIASPAESLIIGGYKSLRLISNSFGYSMNILNSVVVELGIPPIFAQVFVTIILIMIVFAVIYLVFRYK